jgi:hypothetical protein
VPFALTPNSTSVGIYVLNANLFSCLAKKKREEEVDKNPDSLHDGIFASCSMLADFIHVPLFSSLYPLLSLSPSSCPEDLMLPLTRKMRFPSGGSQSRVLLVLVSQLLPLVDVIF